MMKFCQSIRLLLTKKQTHQNFKRAVFALAQEKRLITLFFLPAIAKAQLAIFISNAWNNGCKPNWPNLKRTKMRGKCSILMNSVAKFARKSCPKRFRSRTKCFLFCLFCKTRLPLSVSRWFLHRYWGTLSSMWLFRRRGRPRLDVIKIMEWSFKKIQSPGSTLIFPLLPKSNLPFLMPTPSLELWFMKRE